MGGGDVRAFGRRIEADEVCLPLTESAAYRGLSRVQLIVCIVGVLAVGLVLWRLGWQASWLGLIAVLCTLHVVVAVWRLVLLWASRPGVTLAPCDPDDQLPTYAIVAALLDEAEMLPQLVSRLSRIDYPADRLEGWLMLEAHDRKTIAAARALTLPDWLQVYVCLPGAPQTKPRALNIALKRIRSDFVVVYDAEDDPDPRQLREAAHRFRSDPALVCVQAPLRIRSAHPGRTAFVDQQFALEYAAQFEVVVPGLARLGLPFPLGGTSNHLGVAALREVGGWDSHNVTEDADLGFRLWKAGGKLGTLTRPTWETPPGGTDQWLPQRTRWLKGFVQTFGVHTRRPGRLGWRGLWALCLTLGQTLIAALMHGPTLLWVIGVLLICAVSGLVPQFPIGPMLVLVTGWAIASLSCCVGAQRARIPWRLSDLAAAPVYWAMLSVAMLSAIWQLARAPHFWGKTMHKPETEPPGGERAPGRRAGTGRQVA